MPVVARPVIPDREARITDFGARPDEGKLNTEAFAAAIASLSEKGGGRVIVPAGVWQTGPIVLRSRIELRLERGALIQFSGDRTLYPLVESQYEGRSSWRCQPPIWGVGLEDIAITGEGIIDGSGESWRPVKQSKMTEGQWKKLVASGGALNRRGDIWYPSQGALDGNEGGGRRNLRSPAELESIRDALRPVMVSLVSCKRVLLEGPTFQNSPAWCIHPLLCEDVTVRRINVRNPWYSQNGDGLDLDSCRNAIVEESTFDVGDDAICIKSGRDAEGRRRGVPTENIVVRDCVVYHGHGGFTVGSEMSGGVRNIHVTDCTFIGTDVGLRFKSTRGRGGVVENILIERVRMIGIPNESIIFDLFYGGQGPGERDEMAAAGERNIPPVTEETPAFRNIVMRDVTSLGAGRAALMRGLPEMPLRNIRLENVHLTAREGIHIADAENIEFAGASIAATEGAPLTLRDARDIRLRQLEASAGSGAPSVRVAGSRSASISIVNSPAIRQADVQTGPEVPADALSVR